MRNLGHTKTISRPGGYEGRKEYIMTEKKRIGIPSTEDELKAQLKEFYIRGTADLLGKIDDLGFVGCLYSVVLEKWKEDSEQKVAQK